MKKDRKEVFFGFTITEVVVITITLCAVIYLTRGYSLGSSFGVG